jgi:broad specificity phosphatase PhoE
MAEPVIVDLLRHGEVEGEASIARGCGTDVPLSAGGWSQMRQVGAWIRGDGVQVVATSPMQRCRAFAEGFAKEHGLPLTTLPDMREIDFGHWEGKGMDEIHEKELLRNFFVSPAHVAIPGGEPFEAFAERVLASWEVWLAEGEGSHRLLVVHGMVLRVLLAHLLGMPGDTLWRLHLPYAAWSRVSLLEGEQPRLLFMNRSPCVA